VRYVTRLYPSILFSEKLTEKHLLRYELGRWVLLQKDKENRWYIVNSSGKYWREAVDYLRNFPGVT